MKAFSKIISVLLVCCMLLGLAACGAQEAPQAPAAPENPSITAETK